MKLFSKFQDYYDCTLGSFLESDVVIRRETEIHKVSPKEFAPLGNFEGKWNYSYEGRFGKTYSTWIMHMIGFCGKWYFFKCDSLEFNRDAINPETIEYKTFDEIVKNNKEMSIASYLTRCYHLDRNIDYKNPNDDKFWNSEIFEKYGPVLYMNQYINWSTFKYYQDHKHDPIKLVSWPCLKDYKFQTVVDPYTAMWELEHWFDSHARPDDAIVPVGDDITRLQAYGFDKKTSFRKPKEK